MATDFDPVKAIREELMSLNDIERTLRRQEQHWETAISEAETVLNDVRKLRGFATMQLTAARAKLLKLEQER